MEENQKESQIESESSFAEKTSNSEMTNSFDSNSSIEKTQTQTDGKSVDSDPDNGLILGKFKSVDELTKAYQELQKHQGKCSDELGNLRKQSDLLTQITESVEKFNAFANSLAPVIERDKELYNTPEYLQNPVFKEMYTEALSVFGDNLDTDRLVNLLESYVQNRIEAYNKQNSAKNETESAVEALNYVANTKGSFQKPEKKLDEMTDEEFRSEIRKLI